MAARSQWQAQLRDGVPPEPNRDSPHLSDLISSYSPIFKDVRLSVPKAQMVFWTGIILVLFIAKSLLIGELWEVPWEMVALTGVSQAGYIGDKATKGNSTQSKLVNAKGKKPGEGHDET